MTKSLQTLSQIVGERPMHQIARTSIANGPLRPSVAAKNVIGHSGLFCIRNFLLRSSIGSFLH